MNIKCKSCGSDLEYDYNRIFTHWDYPYVLCPKCCDVVLVPSDIKVRRLQENEISKEKTEDKNVNKS